MAERPHSSSGQATAAVLVPGDSSYRRQGNHDNLVITYDQCDYSILGGAL